MPKQILAADDSATMRRVLAITFSVGDYQIVGVSSADEVLPRARALLAPEHRPLALPAAGRPNAPLRGRTVMQSP